MAKRFTDTNKYKKPFFRSLPGAYKLLWDFLYHDCDHAGVWIVDFEIAQSYIGKDMRISKEKALSLFNSEEVRIVIMEGGKKWFIPSFIEFQYGVLSDKNRAHSAIISVLLRYGFLDPSTKLLKPLTSPLQGVKEKEMDMDIFGKSENLLNDTPKLDPPPSDENPIPSIEDFLAYCKTVLVTEYPKFEFSLKAKFEAWREAGWKDGNGNKVKNWKTKIKNTIPYLRATSIPTLITDIKQHPNYDKALEHDTHIKTVSNIPLEPDNIEYLKRTGRG